MTAGWLLYWLGIITGGAFMSIVWVGVYLWSCPTWHQAGYQDHRDEIRAIRNTADLAAIPEPHIRSKAGPRRGTHRESGHNSSARHTAGLPGDDDLRLPVPASGQARTGMGDEHSPYRDDRAHPRTRRPVTRAYSGADNTPPVIYPEPGTLIPFRAQPAPAKHGATDTGEIRLRGEAFREDMRRRCAVDRAMIERGEPLP